MKDKKALKSLLKGRFTFLILLTIVILGGCSLFFDDTSIEPEILPLLELGDTILYRGVTKIDTFAVLHAKFYNVGEGEGEMQSNWKYERYHNSLQQINCVDSCNNIWASITPSEYWLGANNGYKYYSSKIYDYDDRYANLKIKIGEYQLDKLYRTSKVLGDSVTGKEIKSVLYSKTYGFIEFELTNGEVFTLSEESLEMLLLRE